MKAFNKILCDDIDTFCVQHFGSEPVRSHLGASEIGHDCNRYLWYKFRWFFYETFSGRMYRLFERGHLEEMRFVKWLEGIGCKVDTDDFSKVKLIFDSLKKEYKLQSYMEYLNLNEKDVSDIPAHVHYAKFLGLKVPQFTISDCNGHFGGSMDGKVWLPAEYLDFLQNKMKEEINNPVILEGKTKATGAGFFKLKENGVVLENDQHFTQQSTYGYKTEITHAIYMCANKNDDDLHAELIKLNPTLGKQSVLKADKIINDRQPPEKLSLQSTFFKCKNCAARFVCHENAIPEKNCRSCIYSNPVENAEWYCDFWKSKIPKKNIIEGCGEWSQLA
jgi:hypothetical protein